MGTAAAPLDRKWPFRLALAGWLAVGVGAWFLADGMGRPGQVILAGLWLAGLGLLLRQFLRSLFGPVLAYDALRVGRRPRVIFGRVAYALLLAFLLTWVYFAWASVSRGRTIQPKDMARLAETYFYVYMVVQFILVCLLTPASVAGAIAEEKERRTLEFLLATDLRDREILFGKLASRVGGLLLFLLAGLPILTLMQFFGGIDPDLVLAGFAATVVVALSLSALGIAASVLARKARDAIALTYLMAIAYVLVSGLGHVLLTVPPLTWTVDVFGYTVASGDVSYPFVAGNPFYIVPDFLDRQGRGGPDLFTVLGHFALFHAVAIALLVAWAGLRLRAIALRQTFGGPRQSLFRRIFPARRTGTTGARARRSSRPEVGDVPVLWKEVFVDTGLRLGGFGRVVVFGLVALSFVPVGFIFWFAIVEQSGWRGSTPWWSADRWDDFGEGMNAYLRAAGSVAVTLVFLAIAIRGAGTVSGERDRQSLDVLLTTPLSARSIVWGKWWGCLLGMRWAWAWILGMWILALAGGGIHPVMFPAAVVSMAVYASGFAWIGIFCSLHGGSTLKATMLAIMASVILGGGYFLVFVMCCVVPLSFSGGDPDRSMVTLGINTLCAFSPSVNMGWLPIREFDEWEVSMADNDVPYPPFWVMGLVGWGALSFLLSQACVQRFREMANRRPLPPAATARPRGVPPPLPKARAGRTRTSE